jgi:hypothetical protein
MLALSVDTPSNCLNAECFAPQKTLQHYQTVETDNHPIVAASLPFSSFVDLEEVPMDAHASVLLHPPPIDPPYAQHRFDPSRSPPLQLVRGHEIAVVIGRPFRPC